ncbi:hypothetical protein EUZ85_17050 [Hahella sp. KA22]|uniref:hypothetical protein n=1 Tax=Hahella sp. KA22 TaxID=1628392 RepID=UPI0010102678|nr:hypothetical protein [Hahella sp. KA22]QAY55713.1 hypothetical protein EUZ85_17050 [Hahella sp. KA22]
MARIAPIRFKNHSDPIDPTRRITIKHTDQLHPNVFVSRTSCSRDKPSHGPELQGAANAKYEMFLPGDHRQHNHGANQTYP